MSDGHFVWVVRFLINFTAHYGIEPTNGRTRLELNLIVKKVLDIFHLLLFRSSCLLLSFLACQRMQLATFSTNPNRFDSSKNNYDAEQPDIVSCMLETTTSGSKILFCFLGLSLLLLATDYIELPLLWNFDHNSFLCSSETRAYFRIVMLFGH